MPSAKTTERKTGLKPVRVPRSPTKSDEPKLLDTVAFDAEGNPITRADRIIEALGRNQPVAAACAAGGVHPESHYRWLREGANVAAERTAMAAGDLPWSRITKRAQALWWYATAIAEAEAKGEGVLVEALHSRATGELTAAVVTRELEPSGQLDAEGKPVLIETKRTEKRNKVLPDTAALTFMLRQKYPERWANDANVRVMGDPTQPIEHRVTHSVEGLNGVLEAVAKRISNPIDTSAAEIPPLGRHGDYDGPVGLSEG